ncbi:MAG: C40 family peptidase [Woeseiaceae bacterium]
MMHSNKKSYIRIISVLLLTALISSCGSQPKYNHKKASAKKSAVVSIAKKMLGVKYKYGGSSPKQGFDCSGLVQYSHKSIGKSLPRTTYQLYKSAKPVARRYLQKGDLVFFKTSVSRAVSHVGIYLGNNKFIHAPSSGKRVKINSMNEKYWRKRFAGGGRVL